MIKQQKKIANITFNYGGYTKNMFPTHWNQNYGKSLSGVCEECKNFQEKSSFMASSNKCIMAAWANKLMFHHGVKPTKSSKKTSEVGRHIQKPMDSSTMAADISPAYKQKHRLHGGSPTLATSSHFLKCK